MTRLAEEAPVPRRQGDRKEHEGPYLVTFVLFVVGLSTLSSYVSLL